MNYATLLHLILGYDFKFTLTLYICSINIMVHIQNYCAVKTYLIINLKTVIKNIIILHIRSIYYYTHLYIFIHI